jgi:hypothetical protein
MYRALSRALGRAGVLAVALGGVALAVPSLAQADPACGAVLHHSVTLTSNMVCPSTGLYFGSDGITIHLHGFTVKAEVGIDNAGDWPSNAPGAGGVAGPGTGFNHDTVENGNITQSHIGISVDHTSGMKISNITEGKGTGDGLHLYHSRNASVTGSHFGYLDHGNNNSGASLREDSHLTISRSSFNWNGSFGIFDAFSSTTLYHVTANDNGDRGDYAGGVVVSAPVAPSLIESSKANGNNVDGFKTVGNVSGAIKFVGDDAVDNGGWGFYADNRAEGTNNRYENDFLGGCHNVDGCYVNP